MRSVPQQISVVICTYNRARLLREALESLSRQTIAAADFEVVVVNNNSSDETEDLVAEFVSRHKNVRLIRETRQGLSHARNRGWQSATGEYVAYLDDDAKAGPEWLERILAAFRTVIPTPDVVGGPILPWYETDPPDWFSEDLETRSWGESAGFLAGPQARYGFSGSNITIKKSRLEEAGGFAPELGMAGAQLRMGEDAELCHRLYLDGARFWYDPEIVVEHWVPVAKMRLRYRFDRGLACGAAWSTSRRYRLSPWRWLKTLAALLLCLLGVLATVFQRSENRKARLARLLSRTGYLAGVVAPGLANSMLDRGGHPGGAHG